MALTPKQRKFATEYLKDSNGTRAAIRAGYQPRSASVTASRLLKDHRIFAQIEQRIEKASISADQVINEYALIAFGKVAERLRYQHKLGALDSLAKISGLMRDQPLSEGGLHLHLHLDNTEKVIPVEPELEAQSRSVLPQLED